MTLTEVSQREQVAGPSGAVEAETESADAPVEEFGALRYMTRVGSVMLAIITLSVSLELLVISGLQHRVAQTAQFDKFRKELALGTAPIGQIDPLSGRVLAMGTPVALLEIPSIGLHEVVGEGTTSQVLEDGPGHLRVTPLPGQAGTSVIFGRQSSYGGPFGGIHGLKVGSKIKVTTGIGVSTFRVIDVRRAGDLNPPALASGKGRLILTTATGTSFMPTGLLYVDADLTSATQPSSPTALTSADLRPAEKANAGDTTTLWALVLWLQALVLIAVGIVFSWHRWGRVQTWIVFLPLTSVIGFYTSDQVTRLLPNLL